ncbi:arsenate reductase (azurin) small subunit [Aquabacterium sp. A7-Y]|uniref:arsenate reductase (azurin) small subunit n=1 Tax=Aquabacterium sp. A7-Y TaxID=1349605 RepID=UPI00223DAE1A|nr:arsenate reductase (azurin) small subunit [Aquabacterium sp. A7-Y]MCW7540988.1 arsenate reductase (azurin) small subunit [Aquabacterium sp. A7-Y]
MAPHQNRRGFLKSTATGVTLASCAAAGAQPHPPGTARPAGSYSPLSVAHLQQLEDGASRAFNYPDPESPCLLLKMGKPIRGGIGPNLDIIAFSALCTHMGCPVSYNNATRTIDCPCHFSMFDPEFGGQMICGQATENLPQIQLAFDEKSGRISAVGIHGHLYGRVSNLL